MFLLPRAKTKAKQQLGSLELIELEQFPTFITLGYYDLDNWELSCAFFIIQYNFYTVV